MNPTNPKVDFYFEKNKKWRPEVEKLRSIALDCPLGEELKWGVPCYTHNKSNIMLIHDFKEYCAVLFPKGTLLDDPMGILIQQTENVQSARQVRFTSLKQIEELESALKVLIHQAIEVEKAGLKVEFKKPTEFKVADEFKVWLDGDPALKAAFEALTPGRQRAYLLYFSAPKLTATRQARVERSLPQILAGKGLDD